MNWVVYVYIEHSEIHTISVEISLKFSFFLSTFIFFIVVDSNCNYFNLRNFLSVKQSQRTKKIFSNFDNNPLMQFSLQNATARGILWKISWAELMMTNLYLHRWHLFCPQNFKVDSVRASKQIRKREMEIEKKKPEIRMNLRNFLNHLQLLWFCFCATIPSCIVDISF